MLTLMAFLVLSSAPFNVMLLLRRPVAAFALLASTCSEVLCRYDRDDDLSDTEAVAGGYCLPQLESVSGTELRYEQCKRTAIDCNSACLSLAPT